MKLTGVKANRALEKKSRALVQEATIIIISSILLDLLWLGALGEATRVIARVLFYLLWLSATGEGNESYLWCPPLLLSWRRVIALGPPWDHSSLSGSCCLH